jgi:hypothetical protein
MAVSFPGRRFSSSTSKRGISAFTSATPSGVLRSTDRLRFPALCWMKYGLRLLSPRLKSSPAPGFSTFTTSAPRALSSEVA